LVALPLLKGVERQFCQNEPNLRWRLGEKSVSQYGFVISAVDGLSELMATLSNFFLGLIGEYILAIYGQVREKPVVFELERINFKGPDWGFEANQAYRRRV
jgi:hypothetical protein